MKQPKSNFDKNGRFSRRNGKNPSSKKSSFLNEGIGLILVANSNLNPTGTVIAKDGSLVKAISLSMDVKKGAKVIVVRAIELVGWEVEPYLEDHELESVEVI